VFELRYEEYLDWHEAAEKGFLQPALATALRLFEELLDNRIDPVDRGRFRVSTFRVKSAQRSFAKLNGEKYVRQINSLEDVPNIIDDLVGLRLICNNLSDINTFQEIIGELPIEIPAAAHPLGLEHDSHRDYFANPKPSGYRAYHVNLVVPVPQVKGNRRVRVEVQARTLLQDGWGELTHEDTYKPGSTVPEWIVGMSLRMAELLAAVDNIAQDLRTGLDVEAQRSVREVEPQQAEAAVAFVASGPDAVVVPTPSEAASESLSSDGTGGSPKLDRETEIEAALVKETKEKVRSLRKPLALAALSQQLTLVFGTEITHVWANLGGFKRFLESVVPEAKLSGPAPGYIHPPNTPIPDGWTTEDTGTGVVPEITRELRTYDKALPLIGPERLDQVIVAVANVLQSMKPDRAPASNISASEIDALARDARADAEKRGQLVVLPHATYVLQAANRAGKISPSTTANDLRRILAGRILAMGNLNGLLTKSPDTQQEVREWLGLKTAQATNQKKDA
jgi:ppGpp synthetase/RelA/SpoT-type nucleotidyltranferase